MSLTSFSDGIIIIKKIKIVVINAKIDIDIQSFKKTMDNIKEIAMQKNRIYKSLAVSIK